MHNWEAVADVDRPDNWHRNHNSYFICTFPNFFAILESRQRREVCPMSQKATCAERLREALGLRNMKQSELCELTGIPKSAMSQYVKGSFEPKQDRVEAIAKALNVTQAWLMGYDVPMRQKGSGDEPMDENLKNILARQLQLLFEQSQAEMLSPEELAQLSQAMAVIVDRLRGTVGRIGIDTSSGKIEERMKNNE